MSSNKIETRRRILKATWQLMEQRRGQDVHMRDIAKAAGISRQAVYLHFASRTELMVATMDYVDEVKGLQERLNRLETAASAIELLETCVEVWGNYIPEIYGLAKAMLRTRDTDAATATAWNNSMGCLLNACQEVIAALDREGYLAPEWTRQEAIDMFYTLLSIHNWELLRMERGWSPQGYIDWMKTVSKRTFIDKAKTTPKPARG
jgi:AcrR family transcriptional regulator